MFISSFVHVFIYVKPRIYITLFNLMFISSFVHVFIYVKTNSM